MIFNLPGYRVVDLPLGGRRVKVLPVGTEGGCPACGVMSSRVHAWTEQRVRDVPHARPTRGGGPQGQGGVC